MRKNISKINLSSNTYYLNPSIEAISATASTTNTISANKFYNFGTVTSLDIELDETNIDSTIMNEYMFQFTASDTGATLSLPSNITWYQDYNTITASKTYQVSIVNNLAILGEF